MWNTLLRIVGLLVLLSCTEPSAPELPIRSQSTETLNELPSVNEPLAIANLTLWVAAEKRECMATGPSYCLQIRFKQQEEWQLFYGEIQGFNYEPGQVYQLEVSEILVPQATADAPDRQWVLRQVIGTHYQ